MHSNPASAHYFADLWSLVRKNNRLFFRQSSHIHFKETLPLITKHKCLGDLAQLMALFLYANDQQKSLLEEVCLPWLHQLPYEDIYKIDEQLRASINHITWHSPAATNYSPQPTFFELCVLTCHPDGYIREPAVSAIAQYPEALALTLALIRCNDWASPVRISAKNSTITLFRTLDTTTIVTNWDVLERLSQGKRHQSLDLTDTLLKLVYNRVSNETLHEQLRSHNSRIRRYTAEVMWHNHQHLNFIDLQALCNCSDPFICFKTMRDILPGLELSTRSSLLDSLKRKKWTPARLERLRLLLAENSDSLETELIKALSDRSPAIRNFARFYLKRHSTIDTENHYEVQLDSQNTSIQIASLHGLHEIRSPLRDHYASLFLHESNPRLVAAALTVLPNELIHSHEDFILKKLSDTSEQISKAAYTALTKNPPSIDRILPLLKSEDLSHRNLISLANLLLLQPKWDSMVHALWLCRHNSDSLKNLGLSWLQKWIFGQSHSWVKPSHPELELIKIELDQSASSIRKQLVKELYFIINSFK